jgi:hypothetical protein
MHPVVDVGVPNATGHQRHATPAPLLYYCTFLPVHADVPEIDAVILDGFDDKANVLGAKGADG